MYQPATITHVEVLDGLTARIIFQDGTLKVVDMNRYLSDGPLFGPLRQDLALFRAAFVENGTITWPNGADLDPDMLYLDLPPNASEQEYEAAKAALIVQMNDER